MCLIAFISTLIAVMLMLLTSPLAGRAGIRLPVSPWCWFGLLLWLLSLYSWILETDAVFATKGWMYTSLFGGALMLIGLGGPRWLLRRRDTSEQ